MVLVVHKVLISTIIVTWVVKECHDTVTEKMTLFKFGLEFIESAVCTLSGLLNAMGVDVNYD